MPPCCAPLATDCRAALARGASTRTPGCGLRSVAEQRVPRESASQRPAELRRARCRRSTGTYSTYRVPAIGPLLRKPAVATLARNPLPAVGLPNPSSVPVLSGEAFLWVKTGPPAPALVFTPPAPQNIGGDPLDNSSWQTSELFPKTQMRHQRRPVRAKALAAGWEPTSPAACAWLRLRCGAPETCRPRPAEAEREGGGWRPCADQFAFAARVPTISPGDPPSLPASPHFQSPVLWRENCFRLKGTRTWRRVGVMHGEALGGLPAKGGSRKRKGRRRVYAGRQ